MILTETYKNPLKRNFSQVGCPSANGLAMSIPQKFIQISKKKRFNPEENFADVAQNLNRSNLCSDNDKTIYLRPFFRPKRPQQPDLQQNQPNYAHYDFIRSMQTLPTTNYNMINRYLYHLRKENLIAHGYPGEEEISEDIETFSSQKSQMCDQSMEIDTATDTRNEIENFYYEQNQVLNRLHIERQNSRMGE